ERHFRVLLDVDFRAAFADAHETAAAHAHTFGEATIKEEPDAEEDDCWNDPGQKVGHEIRFLAPRHLDPRVTQLLSKWQFDPRCHELGLAVMRRLVGAEDMPIGD